MFPKSIRATVLFGQTLKMPVLLAPVAYQKIVHPEGELEAVRGANAAGVVFTASTAATIAVEEIAREATIRRGFNSTPPLTGHLQRLSSIVPGKPGAVCFASQWTRPVRGQRDRDTRVGFRLPPGLQRPNFRDLNPQALTGNPRAEGRSIYSPNLDPKLTWEYLSWLRSVARMPIVLKGMVTAEDAIRGT